MLASNRGEKGEPLCHYGAEEICLFLFKTDDPAMVRRTRQLLMDGRVPGAIKDGVWTLRPERYRRERERQENEALALAERKAQERFARKPETESEPEPGPDWRLGRRRRKRAACLTDAE